MFPYMCHENFPLTLIGVLTMVYHKSPHTPPKFNTEPENKSYWKRKVHLESIIFRFHVEFWGSNWVGSHPRKKVPPTFPTSEAFPLNAFQRHRCGPRGFRWFQGSARIHHPHGWHGTTFGVYLW